MEGWTAAQALSLLSALLGATGTGLLFKGSFTLQEPMTMRSRAEINEVQALNRRRRRTQRLGLGLLMAGFLAQAVSVVLG